MPRKPKTNPLKNNDIGLILFLFIGCILLFVGVYISSSSPLLGGITFIGGIFLMLLAVESYSKI